MCVSVMSVCVCVRVSVLSVCVWVCVCWGWGGGGGGVGGRRKKGADTELKTKTPHVNVGNNFTKLPCFSNAKFLSIHCDLPQLAQPHAAFAFCQPSQGQLVRGLHLRSSESHQVAIGSQQGWCLIMDLLKETPTFFKKLCSPNSGFPTGKIAIHLQQIQVIDALLILLHFPR